MKKIGFAILLVWVSSMLAAQAQEKKTLTPDDYKKWQRLSSTKISQDGSWISYGISETEGGDTLYFVKPKTHSVYQQAHGSNPQFTADSKYAVYLIGVSKKKREQMQEKKQAVHYKLAILELASGDKNIYKEVSGATVPQSGSYILMRTYKPKGSKAKGNDIVLYNLDDKSMRTIGNVTASSFNKKGDLLAYITEPANPIGNGVEVIDLATNTVQVLASDTTTFSNLTWQKEGESLAFLHQLKNEDYKEDNQEIIVYRNVYKGWNKEIFKPCGFCDFPEAMRLAKSRLQWAEDESSLFFGIQPWTLTEKAKKAAEKVANEAANKAAEEADSVTTKSQGDQGKQDNDDKPKKSSATEKLPGVDVWHWKDNYIQPRQKKTYAQDKNHSFLCMWQLDEQRFVQIADSTYRFARLTGDQKNAYVYTREPYEPQFRLTYADYYLVDLKSGERTEILKHHTGSFIPSPEGKYIQYFKDKHWWTFNTETHEHINLTSNLDRPFWNIRDDHPAEVRPPFGTGGWMKEDKGVILNDEYDIWLIKPDGSAAEKLTNGREEENIYRIRRMDFEVDYFDPKEPAYLTIRGDKTKKSGFAKMKWGKSIDELFLVNKGISGFGITKAKNTDVFMYTQSTYEESPALYLTNDHFATSKLIASTNPQQADFAWGKAELINFTNKNGKELQGVLHYPANYEPGKQYPMLVYIYEIRSNSLYSYINPSDQSSYNVTNYVQQGFFVFQPDIVYRLDDPGISAVECVVPAVEKVISTGMIDKENIGLMGHSWGAYQTAFIITQTDLFSAAVAGAPLTDMISMYTEVYWNTGSPNQGIFETSQGRFTKPYWEILDKYIQNSPMFQAQNIKTPLLVAFGDQDGAVDWHQGIELYSTMRRMEKPYVMLVYAGENHSVRKKENRLDYTKKINEWYNYYLKGQEAAAWITEGIPYLEKKKMEEAQKKK